MNGPLLLGQSFLRRFKSWSQDNAAHELILQPELAEAPRPAAQVPPTTTLSRSEFDALMARLKQLWNIPAGIEHPEEMVVVIQVRLTRDRRLAAPPVIVSRGSSPTYQVAAEAARRAVLEGQPFNMLRDESYDAWKDMEITFDPKMAFRTSQ